MDQLRNIADKRGFWLDPRTKLLIMAVIATSELFHPSTILLISVGVIPFILLLLNKQYKIAFFYAILFCSGICVQHTHDSYSVPAVINMIAVLLVGLVVKLFPTFMMGAYILMSTSAGECIVSLSRMHIPRSITIPLSVMFRFIPTMQEESASIKDAMRMREVQFGSKKFWQDPIALMEYRFIPLMISVAKIGEELSAAAICRGIDNPEKRTSIIEVGFHAYDFIALGFIAVLLCTAYLFG